jgi:hypothetical protein
MVEKKEFIVKEEPAFRLKIRHWKAVNPENLNSVEFVQECMKDGEVDFASTYQFLMDKNELRTLIKGLEIIANE